MKAALPFVALVVLTGVSVTYAPKALAHLDCASLYQACIESGGDFFDCGNRQAICEITNKWPDGLKLIAAKSND
ncbi:hypothetical protein [Rhodanobacter sp. PCA2]|uniref:hypothetical protein n=1 Tax=Rhodanobacter sp. PCA2 TaxID=2006117 RepID=UPI0015E73DC1|nr:hypothetical protein [Rhodanobacter sp. PCA2]